MKNSGVPLLKNKLSDLTILEHANIIVLYGKLQPLSLRRDVAKLALFYLFTIMACVPPLKTFARQLVPLEQYR